MHLPVVNANAANSDAGCIPCGPAATTGLFHLTMRAHKKKCKVPVTLDTSVSAVHDEVGRLWGVSPCRVVLLYRGVELPVEGLVGDAGITKDCNIDLQIRGEKDKEQTCPPRCCPENEFDNVRVMRGHMIIRCRICERKIRAPLEKVKQWKCEPLFNTGTCANGPSCPLLHLHFRKRSLKERIEAHGPQILQAVGKSAAAAALEQLAEEKEKVLEKQNSAASLSDTTLHSVPSDGASSMMDACEHHHAVSLDGEDSDEEARDDSPLLLPEEQEWLKYCHHTLPALLTQATDGCNEIQPCPQTYFPLHLAAWTKANATPF